MLLALHLACRAHPAALAFQDDCDKRMSRSELSALQTIADDTVREARSWLPTLPSPITVYIIDANKVIAETGESGSVSQPDRVNWVLDRTRPEGGLAIIRAHMRCTLLHELHHLVRDAKIPRTTLMDEVVAEGLATAFERDACKRVLPWGAYEPKEARRWVFELKAAPSDAPRADWLYAHPDGRRWVGLRAGTYLVDEATKRKKLSAAELVLEPTSGVADPQ
jgi:uncharacterized protein YjaZ